MAARPRKASSGMFMPRKMHRSPAWRKLTAIQIFILNEFYYRRKLAQIGRRGEWVIENNGEIIFSYDEAEKKFKISRSTFCRAIDRLVELGFIDIAHHGGGMLKDCSKYAISDRWEENNMEKFKKEKRQKDTRGLGFTKDKWEEQTGRKRNVLSKASISSDTGISISHDTRSSITADTESSIVHATLKIDPKYYMIKGLEVLEAMRTPQYQP